MDVGLGVLLVMKMVFSVGVSLGRIVVVMGVVPDVCRGMGVVFYSVLSVCRYKILMWGWVIFGFLCVLIGGVWVSSLMFLVGI